MRWCLSEWTHKNTADSSQSGVYLVCPLWDFKCAMKVRQKNVSLQLFAFSSQRGHFSLLPVPRKQQGSESTMLRSIERREEKITSLSCWNIDWLFTSSFGALQLGFNGWQHWQVTQHLIRGDEWHISAGVISVGRKAPYTSEERPLWTWVAIRQTCYSGRVSVHLGIKG